MNIFITLFENVNKSRASANSLSLTRTADLLYIPAWLLQKHQKYGCSMKATWSGLVNT
jgi:hypothetical protein